jgi:hypothetical protein
MKLLSMSHYSESLKALYAYLQETTEYDYGAVLAGILSLIMAEVGVTQFCPSALPQQS